MAIINHLYWFISIT